jgi:hypothetical protein
MIISFYFSFSAMQDLGRIETLSVAIRVTKFSSALHVVRRRKRRYLLATTADGKAGCGEHDKPKYCLVPITYCSDSLDHKLLKVY